jgi:hypothetical protein
VCKKQSFNVSLVIHSFFPFFFFPHFSFIPYQLISPLISWLLDLKYLVLAIEPSYNFMLNFVYVNYHIILCWTLCMLINFKQPLFPITKPIFQIGVELKLCYFLNFFIIYHFLKTFIKLCCFSKRKIQKGVE